MAITRIIIFANARLPNLEAARGLLRPADFLIGADGGVRHILALDRIADLVVGDMDSLDGQSQARLEQAGVKMVRYPRDKNETDLELAIRHALELAPESILIVGALGDRLDQTIANLALLTDDRFAAFDIRLDDGVEAAFFCRSESLIHGQPGDIVSLIPWGADVSGVLTEGLKWPLKGETLFAHQTRGVSNEMAAGAASVRIQSGVLLVVHGRLTRG